ncbi:hypothetical protein HYH03_006338 [Edaphochlamys debaryana]|uniref:GTPase Der n=1 Tax=Edaphochlamys debaryana TaxID=47281 RepID=A0A835YBA8_9CHLO|nr:hypothetical protein HYH03_006338 [Edaphochlamys debaryana]|eukprot:KAG2495740.1 hypothetical protein HYH03_006338 [Edaphochlamys debaryana]
MLTQARSILGGAWAAVAWLHPAPGLGSPSPGPSLPGLVLAAVRGLRRGAAARRREVLEQRQQRLKLQQLDDALLPKVALVGRPNVGKSALFNRLVRRRAALVYDTPGSHVTRDYQEGRAQLGDMVFRVADTSGLEPRSGVSIQARATALTAQLLRQCHAALLVVDARDGVLPADEEVSQWLRAHVPVERVLVVANKAESGRAREEMPQTVYDCYRLGFGEPVALSATTGEGLADLFTALQPQLDAASEALAEEDRQRREAARAEREQRRQARREQQQQQQQREEEEEARAAAEEEAAARERAGAAGRRRPRLLTRAQAQAAAEAERREASGLGPVSDADAEEEGRRGRRAGRAALFEGGSSEDEEEEEEGALGDGHGGGVLKLAIMGLPNAGKSTLLNTLLGEERALTGPEPGLTRDAVAAAWVHGGRRVELIDTAGWIAQNRTACYDDVGGAVATMTRRASTVSLAQVHVVLLVVDAEAALRSERVLSRRELALAGSVLREGKALVLVANKADALSAQQRKTYLQALRRNLSERFLEAGTLPVVEVSARSGQGVEGVMPAVAGAYAAWNRRVTTARLNRFVRRLSLRMMGSGMEGAMARVKFIVQVKARPPTFTAFMAGSAPVDRAFSTFLAAQIRGVLGFEGVPLRLWFRYKEKRADRLKRLAAESQQRRQEARLAREAAQDGPGEEAEHTEEEDTDDEEEGVAAGSRGRSKGRASRRESILELALRKAAEVSRDDPVSHRGDGAEDEEEEGGAVESDRARRAGRSSEKGVAAGLSRRARAWDGDTGLDVWEHGEAAGGGGAGSEQEAQGPAPLPRQPAPLSRAEPATARAKAGRAKAAAPDHGEEEDEEDAWRREKAASAASERVTTASTTSSAPTPSASRSLSPAAALPAAAAAAAAATAAAAAVAGAGLRARPRRTSAARTARLDQDDESEWEWEAARERAQARSAAQTSARSPASSSSLDRANLAERAWAGQPGKRSRQAAREEEEEGGSSRGRSQGQEKAQAPGRSRALQRGLWSRKPSAPLVHVQAPARARGAKKGRVAEGAGGQPQTR